MDNEIKVSICCLTYNHEKFIKQTIDGFLKQKTNFKYEILIRDDASTDNTANIIREYQEKYPELIHVVYEKINGRTRGVKRASSILIEKAKGKYIALCEGDDYWIDENKLQIQYDYMENNEKCSLFVHNGKKYNMQNKKFTIYNTNRDFRYLHKKISNMDLNAGEMSLVGLCAKFLTASMFYRKKDVEKFPDFYYQAIVGDMPLKMILANCGYVHYDKRGMSVYRINSGNSTLDRWNKESDIQKITDRYNKFINIIDEFNKYSKEVYEKELNLCKKGYLVEILLVNKDIKSIILNKEYRQIYIYKSKDIFFIKLFIRKFLPKLFNKVKSVRRRK